MQRYSAASCGGGVNNSAVGGTSARDTARVDSSFASSNFSPNQRRPSLLTPYKLKCEKEPLSCRLGPPDFYPQTPNCPEETLTREYLQSGYKETVDGIEEAKEIALTHVGSLTKHGIINCKEAIRRRLRAINESRAQKRKAGQVYGVPLSGTLLIKPGVFPEQRQCPEDFRKKWIEGLSQQHKRLRSLGDQVPHGYRKKSLFEVLIRHNVPLLRATWFIKVIYLNQVRPASIGVSSGAPDKAQLARTELWTKDVFDYLQYLLEGLFPKDGSFPAAHSRDQSPQTFLSGPPQHRSDSVLAIPDGEEPSVQYKWWYMVRLLQWHHAEGLVFPSLIIEWVFKQLQEKESVEALELLLPIIFDVIESIALSQNYVRMLVDVAVRSINDLYPGGLDLTENSRKSHVVSALVEMVRYLMLAVPDTFVGLDCFPLPTCVVPDIINGRSYFLKVPEGVDKVQYGSQDAYHQYLSFGYVVSSVQKRAASLAKIANPSIQGHGVAKVVQALDKALILGDVRGAYNCLFEELSDAAIEECWIQEVSPCLRSSLKWAGTFSLSMIFSVFFLCEWATCDFRDCRTAIPQDVNFTGRKDFSQVYFAVSLLKLKMEDMHNLSQSKNGSSLVGCTISKAASLYFSGGTSLENTTALGSCSKSSDERINPSDILQSPGPLHDIVVCWLDQHEAGKGEGFQRLQLLIMELIRCGIFYPQAYARQLIVSGIIDRNETALDINRQRRHHRILKQLPGTYLLDALEEARIAEVSLLHEAVSVYSNERRLVLHGLFSSHSSHLKSGNDSSLSFAPEKFKDHSAPVRDVASPSLLENRRNFNISSSPLSYKHAKTKALVAELKTAISTLLHFPNSCSSFDTRPDESQGNLKRALGTVGTKIDLIEGTPGCEECRRTKRQKLSDDMSSPLLVCSSNPSDDEDTWWVRKGPKSVESFKVELPLKSTKHASRGRRKTQSLAQLQAARIEGSQGASTSHVCDSKVSCPHHKSGVEGEIPKSTDGIKTAHLSDIAKTLKQLRLLEKRSITIWLLTSVRQLVEGNEKSHSQMSHCTGPFSPSIDERCSVRWKLGENELSSVLYLLDISSDLFSAVKFLLWLLPKLRSGPNSSVHVGRNVMMLPKNKENHVFDVGEAFLVSAFQRYENVLVATDLLPEALSAAMHRAMAVTTTHGRASGSAAFSYARNLLKKYGNVVSVAKWEKSFKATCDQKLFSELEAGRLLDSDLGYSLGVPAGVEDSDDYFRQNISGRISRAGPSMKEIVQRHVEEAVHYFYGKERKPFVNTNMKSSALEKWDDGNQVAQQIVLGLVDCIRQNNGASPEVDPLLVASAVSAIVGNVGPAIAKLPDFTASSNYQSFSSTTSSWNCVRRILHIHITCLCLLKEALGERLSRVFEIALGTEASSTVSGAFPPGKTPRCQFQPSPEIHDINPGISNDILSSSAKNFVGRAAKAAAAVSALVVGAIVHGVASLERMVTVFKLKEGLDILQFIRSARSSSNGISRSVGTFKLDNCIEVHVHWFRLLVGNCRTVFDGLVADILGDSYTLALSRMQRTLPLNLVFPPSYSIFAMVIWRPYILNSNIATREDIQLYQYLSSAIGDAIRHQPFRDLCIRDTRALYDLLASDVSDSEFASMLELHSPDKHLKTMAFIPLRARLFLHAIIDCKMPSFTLMQDDGTWVSGHGEPRHAETETKLLDQLVHVLDTLQPAKFHWQWVELRLLLNEQALIEKIETHSMSLVEAIRSLSPNAENFTLSENENTFAEIVLTRLLIRPDAAPLYSEVFHLLGRSLEEKLLLHVKWFLAGNDVLLGRKSIRQRLINLAQPRGLLTKPQFWKPWGWSSSTTDASANRADKRKLEASSLEEGEVVDEGMDIKKSGRSTFQKCDGEGFNYTRHYVTEKALAELVLPCIDRSSSESRNTFATELVKQMNTIDQHINALTRVATKQAGAVPSGVEVSANKGSTRKGIRGGSPGLGRRPMGTAESVPPSAGALRASMWLRLQFLLRLLPIIYSDREPSVRNMRHMLASALLHLLGTRVVYEDADLSFSPMQGTPHRREGESSVDTSLDFSGDSLFDMFLSVLHGLLSGCKPNWLKASSVSKSTVKSPRDFSAFDREVVESLQADLDRMQLPASIRRRLQAAMPMLPPSPSLSISCHPPSASTTVLASLQSSVSSPGLHQANANPPQRTVASTRPSSNMSARIKPLPSQDPDMEIDPWTLLEEGTGSSAVSNNSSNVGSVGADHSNLRACSWLKGAVRVRRTDLTYIGAVDDS